jgi:hypothetical protein
MSFNQAMMDDLIVVPTITLNPKKAKKKLKKAARMSDDVEVTQLPVYQEVKEEVSPLAFSVPPKEASPKTTKASPKNRSQVRSTPAPKPVAEPAFFKSAQKMMVTNSAPKPQTCAAQALATSEVTKRSWFDITEEDDDDFLGFSFTQCSGPQMVA